MRNVIIFSIALFAFCIVTQPLSAQQADASQSEVAVKTDSDKDKLLKKYAWLKTHVKDKANKVLTIKEVLSSGASGFVLIETGVDKILYDKDGVRYCTESSSLNCEEFYKLTPGDLKWTRS